MKPAKIRGVLNKMAKTVVAAGPQLPAEFYASTANQLAMSPEFQDFVTGRMKKLGRPVGSLTSQEYTAFFTEFSKDAAQLFV